MRSRPSSSACAGLVGAAVAAREPGPGDRQHAPLEPAARRDGGDVEEEQRPGHVGLTRTETRIGPVDHRCRRTVHHDVQRVEVAVAHHGRPGGGRAGQVGRSLDGGGELRVAEVGGCST